MIIGIDETGDFSLASKGLNFFVAFHVTDEEGLGFVKTNFEIWKERNKKFKDKKGKNEIKGSVIDENAAQDFAETVLFGKHESCITAYAVETENVKKADVQYVRDRLTRSLDHGILQTTSVNNGNAARQLTELRNWYKKLPYQLIIKEHVLGHVISDSFRSHVIKVAITQSDHSLNIIRISIDQDFIKEPAHIMNWKELLRNQFYQYTYENPIPIIKEWPEEHPFFMSRNKQSGRFLDEEQVFRNSVNFGRSENSTEIQIADITASIYNRYYNGRVFKNPFELVKQKYIKDDKFGFALLGFPRKGDVNPNPAPNPFE